jgi:hypothetical protein
MRVFVSATSDVEPGLASEIAPRRSLGKPAKQRGGLAGLLRALDAGLSRWPILRGCGLMAASALGFFAVSDVGALACGLFVPISACTCC